MKWEYCIFNWAEVDRRTNIKKLGLEGWEMCGAVETVLFFKRPIVESAMLVEVNEKGNAVGVVNE